MSALRSNSKPFTASKASSRRITSLVLPKLVSGRNHAHINSHVAKVQTTEDRIATQTIDDLDRDYCDDFQCTSSPAVEQTVRSFARDCTRLKYTTSLFNKDCTYSDGFRSFKGNDKYARQKWYAENIQKPVVTITKMRMLDKATAQIDWRVVGQLNGANADIGVTSTIEMNLLTGRITSHKEQWDVSKVGQPAGLIASLGRMAWSLQQATQDTKEKVQESTDSMNSGGSVDFDNMNTNDPTKFFMNQGQQDNQMNDYISFATLAAVLYFLYKAFGELEKIQ